ncbi:terminase family protein [Pararoseomonas sp. SCSIO 73927]|uniref:terminase large subunit domain-containing protein n=1 Tax=Pararoseomonas sp. SCSIO 73927 TaxID=3114537 RepID=UPI0030CC5945
MSTLITEEEWKRHRAEAMTMSAVGLLGGFEEGVLLPYQAALVEEIERNEVVICEKSRRIGATWGVGSKAVLLSAAKRSERGMDTFYIGYNLEMAREFIDVCAMWAAAFDEAATTVAEFLFEDRKKGEDTRHIQAFRIAFASGFEIVALSSRPRSLRGRQGFVIIDEAAFHEALAELIKAAIALLMWGGKVLIISTHDGEENYFNELIKDARAEKNPYKVVRIAFDEAIEQGLYARICLVRGMEYSIETEAAFRAKIRAFYGTGAGEELDAIPSSGGGKFLPLSLIEARTSREIPVRRWRCEADFVHKPDHVRTREAFAWCEEELGPLLRLLDPLLRSAFGQDFARVGDLTVMWPLQVRHDLRRHTPFIAELRNVPYEQQREILFYICDRLPRFTSGVLDAGGNGGYLAERAMQRYGAHRIEMLHLTEGWYRDQMPKLKAAFEDASFDLPADDQVVDDFRQITLVRGVPRIPEKRTFAKGEDKDKAGGQRHGDAAVAGAISFYAAGREVGSTEHDTLPSAAPLPPSIRDFLGLGGRTSLADYVG